MGSVPDETLRATVRVIVIAIGDMVVGICQPESQLPKEGHANTRERTGRLLNFILAFRGERKCSSARQMGISDAAQRLRGGGAPLPSRVHKTRRKGRCAKAAHGAIIESPTHSLVHTAGDPAQRSACAAACRFGVAAGRWPAQRTKGAGPTGAVRATVDVTLE
ncbi:hypothetical protein Purlil1_8562 [Purpureocillium lilacinum]|uniref:Uncharacterized protein n=1 Tax=Purpureocillium lilacinum TaxID=33203 RepID=A0ABR0BSL2_PURLI|nr:hypothetical protein Purlil1_8562 [Purpureocillium lilacinum]